MIDKLTSKLNASEMCKWQLLRLSRPPHRVIERQVLSGSQAFQVGCLSNLGRMTGIEPGTEVQGIG